MATVKPFRALRYNLARAQAAPAALVCPPYDVIDPAMQEALYRKSAYNVVRIELGQQQPGDQPGADRYSRAAATLREWVREGILVQDTQPAFYLYEQTFDIASGGASCSKVVTRRGLFGACWLEPFGSGCVYAHEETFGGPKADRLKLWRACEANLSPVFGLLPDEDRALTDLLERGVKLQAPDFEVTEAPLPFPSPQRGEGSGERGVVNKLWAISEPAWCAAVAETLKPRNIFIADGHHRYETSCNYREERRAQDGDPQGKLDKDYNYTLMMCVPMSDPGLYILPTHRLIQTVGGSRSSVVGSESEPPLLPTTDDRRPTTRTGFLAAAQEFFEIQAATETELLQLAEEQSGPVRFGVIFSDGSRAILAVKPAVAAAMAQAAPKKSAAWRELDVSVLQEIVLKGILKLSEEKVLRKEGVSYTPDTRQALQKVTAGGAYAMGFILRPTRIEQVREVAAGGEKMPQKSTYFYPKLLTGMVLRKL